MLARIWQFHQKILKPKSKSKIIAGREFILNVLLLSAVYLTGIALALNILNKLWFLIVVKENFRGIDPLFLLLIFVSFVFLLYLSKKNNHKIAAHIFLLLLWFPTAYSSLRWGATLPQALLIFSLIIITTGILLNPKIALATTFLTTSYLIIITILHEENIVAYDSYWRERNADIGSTLVVALTLLVIVIVSWLYAREIKNSLRAEEKSYAALIRERDSLEKKVEERTKQLRLAQAEQMSQWYRFMEIGRMASEIFHDIRNPLTTASLSLEEIKTSSTPATTAWNSIQLITRFVEANQRQVQKQTALEIFSPVDEISLALQALQAKARKRQVVLKSNLVAGTLYGNPLKFYQVVINLVSNAIDSYLDFPTKKQIVTITLKKNRKRLHLIISDKGAGIRLSDHPYVFDPLFTTKSTEHGTGLGLAVTKTAIEQDFNSTILFCSQPAKGTTFITYFPLGKHAAS